MAVAKILFLRWSEIKKIRNKRFLTLEWNKKS